MERRILKTPAGNIKVSYTGGGLYELSLPSAEGEETPVSNAEPKWLFALREELQQYFSGDPVSFSCPVDYAGYPPFFRRALAAAAAIPHGEVRSYRWLAEAAGSPGAARAAGQAMAKNRTPLVIPCHRVVRTDGVIGGFSGGPGWKERLLELEKRERL